MWHREDYISLVWCWCIVVVGYVVLPLCLVYGLYALLCFIVDIGGIP